jgi:hypothetical protein
MKLKKIQILKAQFQTQINKLYIFNNKLSLN